MPAKKPVRKKQGTPRAKPSRSARKAKARVPFEFLPDIATADLAFRAYGVDIDSLFANAALAVCDATVDPKSVAQEKAVDIHLESDTLENLLFDFLSEIVYRKDVDQTVFADCKAVVAGTHGAFRLHAKLFGERIDRKKHRLHSDIKAITLHMFSIKKTTDGYEALVVVDI